MAEHTSLIEIDEAKFDEYFGEGITAAKAENCIAKMLTTAEFSRDGIARTLGTADGYDKHHDGDAYAEIEEQCPKHPSEWYAVSPASLAKCWRCQSEARGQ